MGSPLEWAYGFFLLALLIPSYMILLSKLLNLSETQFSTPLFSWKELVHGTAVKIKEMIHINTLVWCLAQKKCSVKLFNCLFWLWLWLDAILANSKGLAFPLQQKFTFQFSENRRYFWITVLVQKCFTGWEKSEKECPSKFQFLS